MQGYWDLLAGAGWVVPLDTESNGLTDEVMRDIAAVLSSTPSSHSGCSGSLVPIPTTSPTRFRLVEARPKRMASTERSASSSKSTTPWPRPRVPASPTRPALTCLPSIRGWRSRCARCRRVSLPNVAWARPQQDQGGRGRSRSCCDSEVLWTRHADSEVRLAGILVLEPRLLSALLTDEEAATWRRLVGGEAAPLQKGMVSFVPSADRAWARPQTAARGSGLLVEDGARKTWAPGPGSEPYRRTVGLMDALAWW